MGRSRQACSRPTSLVVDLSGIAPNTAIEPALLADKGAHIRAGDIVLLKTCWDQVASLHAPEFWTTAPYLTREACNWLLEMDIKALGVDFPQDYPIRGLLTGQTAPITDFVSHDVLVGFTDLVTHTVTVGVRRGF